MLNAYIPRLAAIRLVCPYATQPACRAVARFEPKETPGPITIENRQDAAEMLLYGQIGFDWWGGEGTTAAEFHDKLAAIKAPRINLRINSPGGDVFDGLAIYNQLKRHNAEVVVDVDGYAASAASLVAMAGDSVYMGRGA